MFKRLNAILLSLALCVGIITPISADASNTPIPRWSYTSSISVTFLDIDPEAGIAECSAALTASQNLPIKIVCELQRYVGGLWATIKSWEATDNLQTEVYGRYAVYTGYWYRVKATGYVYNSSNVLLETVTKIGSEQYYSGN